MTLAKQNYLRYTGILGVLVLLLLVLNIPPVFATGVLSLTVTSNAPDPIQTGAIYEYLLDFSCAGVTGGCGDLSIDVPYDSGVVDVVQIFTNLAQGYTAVDNGTSITITKLNFNDGDVSQATIRFRVRHDLPTGGTIPAANIVGSITTPSGPPTVTRTINAVTINTPTFQWSTRKTMTLPTGGVNPSVDYFARYQVQFCSDSATGNVSIANGVMVDQYPVGAVVLEADGGVLEPPNFIRWDLGPLDIAVIGNSCITRTIDLLFPDPPFSLGSNVDNISYGYEDPTNVVTDPYDGTCIAPCIAAGAPGGTTGVTLSPPQANPAVNKVGPGTTVITNPGVGFFSFGFNLTAANSPMLDTVMQENIPLAPNSPPNTPAILVQEIRSGAWNTAPDILEAQVWYSTDGGTTYTQLPGGNIDGNPEVTWTAPADFPLGITNLQWRFQDPVPMGFSFGTQPVIQFTPNPGLVSPGDYEDPAPGTQDYRDYDNCINLSYRTVDMAAIDPPIVTADTCAPTRISNSGTANILWNKSAGPNPVDSGNIVTFTLTMELTPQSSTSLVNPFYTDTLDGILSFINWDNELPYTNAGQKFDISFTNTGGGDITADPFVHVDTVGGQTRLRFFWTNDGAFPLTNGASAASTYTRTAGLVGIGDTNNLVIQQPVPPPTQNKIITIRFKARVDPDAIAGGYSNAVTVATNSPGLFCQGGGTSGTDVTDIDLDAITGEVICNTAVNFNVREVATTEAFKWIRSTLLPTENVRFDLNQYNPDFTLNPAYTVCAGLPAPNNNIVLIDAGGDYVRTPCVAQANLGEEFDYKLVVTNQGNILINNFILYDILPHIGDFGVSQATVNQARDTEFMVWLRGPITVNASFPHVVEYNTSTNPCRPEMSNTADESSTAWHAGCSNTWQTAAAFTTPADWATVRSFRIRQTDNTLANPANPSDPANLTTTLGPGQSLVIDIVGYIPTHAELTAAGLPVEADRALTGEIAWNNFAYRFTSATTGNRLLTAEPRKVGIRIPQRLSVGNRVWIDDGAGNPVLWDNRIRNGAAGEVGVDNVTLHLYRYEGADAGFNPANFNLADPNIRLVATTVTANDGYYLFEDDQTYAGAAYDYLNNAQLDSLRPGRYFIYIPPDQFDDVADPLWGYVSSTGITGDGNVNDDRDRGFDNGLGAEVNPLVNGVRSNWFSLAHNTAPTGEADRFMPATPAPQPYGPYGRGTYFQSDVSSDLIRDFGFVKPMSIGNRIWFDTGTNTGIGHDPGNGANNGVFDPIEQPVAGVTVRLYRVQGGTGNPVYNGDGTPAIQTAYFNGVTPTNTYNPVAVGGGGDYIETTTNAQGYYQFENLLPGNYVVFLPGSNFTFANSITGDAVLATYANSTGNTAADGIANPSTAGLAGTFGDGDDNRDKGIEREFQATNGIYSPVVHLRPVHSQTETETDLGTRQHGEGITNDNSNITVDMGFFQPPMSLGNRVWRDYDNDGIHDAGEPGIPNVRVELFFDENGDGIPDDGNPAGPTNATLAAPGAPLAFMNTDPNGYYRFDNLRPGRYVVRVAPSNFAADTDTLFHFANSTPTNNNGNIDMNDDGITPATAAQYAAQGVYSSTVQLIPVSEPNHTADGAHTGTAGEERDLGTGQGTGGDRNTDLTVDFGFYRPSSLGNRVWLDNGAGGGAYNDGEQNGNEPNQGIPNVRVDLYRDNGSGTFDPATDALVGTTTTDATGFYLFDGLPEQDFTYFVWVHPDNFTGLGALVGLDNSLPDFADNVDRNDNGIYTNYPATFGVASNPILVNPIATGGTGWAPTGETELGTNLDPTTGYGPDARGRFRESDNYSNLTIDFGFHAPRFSLGNFVWYDLNNNGLYDTGTENPVANIVVRLYADADNNGIPDTLITNPLQTTTTNADGFYLFDDLPEGRYVVWVDADNFRSGNPLFEYYSSNGAYNDPTTVDPLTNNTRDDSRDNGVDNANPVVNGIFSHSVSLTKNSEPVGETHLSTNPAHGPAGERRGNQGQIDSNSNLTIDFGFYKPMSLGNRVWFDIDGNGLIDGSETGIAGVRVELWLDPDSDGNPNTPYLRNGNPYFVTTNANGHYLFDNLTPGNYVVVIPASNFNALQPLNGLFSTQDDVNVGAPADLNRVDNNDNGIGNNTAVDILSASIQLTLDSEPTAETDLGSGIGTNGEVNRNSNLTIDFGFTGQLMSLGNRVWFDPDNNGVLDGTEAGIANVAVSLYRDTNNDGVPDGAVYATTTTDAQGHYLFDNLPPGNYIVALNNNNFNAGQPLESLVSSTGAYSDPVTNAGGGVFTRDDSRDNGLNVHPGYSPTTGRHPTYGLMSATVALVANEAPQNEADIGAQGTGAGGSNNNSNLTVDFGLYRPMSLGNRVWYDLNDNGLQELTETGITGVTLELWLDTTNDGNPDTQVIRNGNPYTTTTDANGYYLFDGLPTGNYVVVIPPSQFNGVAPLVGLTNSTPTDPNPLTGETTVDRNDNGINDVNPTANGIRSNVIPLTPNNAPTSEADLSNNPAHGIAFRGTNGETDNNSNLTVDFGFFAPPMSLGNRVWIDEGAGGGVYRDGIWQAGEPGVDNVQVNLYFDNNSDGIPDGASIANTVTTGGGYYLFDNLSPGRYLVQLAPTNFTGVGALVGYGSTATTANGTDDSRDNGIDGSSPELNGIWSNTVVLTRDLAPVGEADLGPQGTGAGGSDQNSNLLIDFGVFRPMSLGNRVWFDNGAGALTNNGSQDAGELGVANVRVELWLDDDLDGIPDTPYLRNGNPYFVNTSATGYYLFDGLEPSAQLNGGSGANYVVVIPASNFNGTGALVGLTNSTPTDPDPLTGETATDLNDNGINDVNPAANGIRSNAVSLVLDTAPTGETDLSGNAFLDGPNSRGRNGETNNNSNLTIDFGFFTNAANLMSLGNRVWLDNGGTGLGIANNGIQDGDEVGVNNVTVQIYADPNGDGVPDGAVIQTTTTNTDGYYLFENLLPGNYVVVIPPTNFSTPTAPLYGLMSSTGNFVNDATLGAARNDQQDNGIDVTNPAASGIRSGTIQLVFGNEPLTEDFGALPTAADDDNSNLTVDFGFVARFDWGDAPDSGAAWTFPNGSPALYGTSNATSGPSHGIVSTLYIGARVDDENDGQPSTAADADDTNGVADDEDGVSFPPLIAGTAANVEVTVYNNTGEVATLVGWIDFNGNGVFDPTEAASVTVPSSPSQQVVQLTFNVPNDADLPPQTGGTTFARFRLTTDPAINTNTPTGAALNGEVEDYQVPIQPPGVYIHKTDGRNSIVVGQNTTYTVTIRNSATNPVPVIGRPFDDVIDPNLLNPTWTCTANALASCISGNVFGTGTNGAGNISLLLDLDPGGEIIISITAQLNPALIPPPNIIVNEALFLPETARDESGVIFDPPNGTKTGVVLGDTRIRWTMVWFNTSAAQAATITDPIRAGQTFAGNLVCTAFGNPPGASVTTTCAFDPVTNTVTWAGTIDQGNANRVEIAFDVTVPGAGTYDNTATLTTNPPPGVLGALGVFSATASNTVNIGGIGGGGGGGGEGAAAPAQQTTPILAAQALPAFFTPGVPFQFVATVTNPGNAPVNLNGAVLSTILPNGLTLQSAVGANGTVTVNGATINMVLAPIPPGGTATLTLNVVLPPNFPGLSTSMIFVLTLPDGTTIVVEAVAYREPTLLPATGERTSFDWRLPALLALLSLSAMSLAAFSLRSYR